MGIFHEINHPAIGYPHIINHSWWIPWILLWPHVATSLEWWELDCGNYSQMYPDLSYPHSPHRIWYHSWLHAVWSSEFPPKKSQYIPLMFPENIPIIFPWFSHSSWELPWLGLVLFGRSIGSLCALHLGILGYGEAPGNPPSNHPYGGGLAIYDHPSRSHMLYLHAGLVPPNYTTVPKRIPL